MRDKPMCSRNDEYRDRTRACWQGKNAGGTLGMPFEGEIGPLDLRFYEPVPTEPLPNDDLDLQVVWATHLLGMPEPAVTPAVLARAWAEHVDMAFDEYAVCQRNLAYGLEPPFLGQYDNWFAHGMGAAIRTELWACLAPGDPERAAAFAYCDACCDHAGEGVWAAVFLAAAEALAFTHTDTDRILDGAAALLPPTSVVRQALADTRRWHAQGLDWRDVRARILSAYGRHNFTDVAQNLAFIVLGLLYGAGDFGRSLCLAVNCGQDTDCTGATLGALLGILDPAGIPDEWLAPIGNTLRLSPGFRNLSRIPATVDEFTDQVLMLRERLRNATYAWQHDVLPAAVPDPATAPIRIPLQVRFAATADRAPAGSEAAESVSLPGHWNRFERDRFRDSWMILTGTLRVAESGLVRVVACGTTRTRTWVDGQAATDWPGGPFVPAAHRSHPGTGTDLELAAGEHELTVALARPQGPEAEIVLMIADPETSKWRPWALAEPVSA